jgi:hypothetical protein
MPSVFNTCLSALPALPMKKAKASEALRVAQMLLPSAQHSINAATDFGNNPNKLSGKSQSKARVTFLEL